MSIAFETEDDVHKMLKQLRTRERAFLRDMPNQHNTATGGLRQRDEVECAAAKLRDRTWRGRDVGAVNKLDRIDEHDGCTRASGLLDDPRDVRLAQDEEAITERFRAARADNGLQPLGAESHLLRALFARRVQRGAPTRGDRGCDLHQECALSDPRIAAEKHDGAGNDTAAEYSVELADPRRNPRHLRLRDFRKRDRAADSGASELLGLLGRCAVGTAPNRRRARLGGLCLHRKLLEAVPRAAVGALPLPLRVIRAAIAAQKFNSSLSHGARRYRRFARLSDVR